MSKVEDFLTQEEEQEIVEAIRIMKNTSGEIRDPENNRVRPL
jgi:hypothetical protein